jgi:PAS domain S-box-containing protein
LIVDDSELNLVFLASIIKNLKANLIQAHSGFEALEKIKGLSLALAILDVRMPVMDGYDLALRINETKFDEKVPIIFLTASHVNELDLFKGYSSGAVDYLLKPFVINVLLSKINVFLELFNQKQIIILKANQLQQATNELTRVNSELKKSEEKYRSYVDNAPDGVFVTDGTGKYIEVNDAACKITGYTKDELLTMSISDLYSKESLKPSQIHFKKAIMNGTAKDDLIFRHKNGTSRWWSKEAVKLSDTRFLGFTKDITHRKESEEVLRGYQIELELKNDELTNTLEKAQIAYEKYAELYDFAPLGYFTLSKDNSIQDLNHSGAQILDKERSLLIGANFGFFISKNTLPVFNAFIQDIFENNTTKKCEVILELEANTSKVVHIEGKAVGNGKQCLLNVVDISERKIAEQKVIVNEKKYRTLLNASPDGILLTDLNWIINEVSEIGLEILGAVNPDDVIGKEFFQFVLPDEKDTIQEIINKTLSEGLVQNIELKMKKINQSVFAGETSATLIQDPGGAPVSYMIILRDISQRKKIETKQLHADRMANLGEMASGIAHEINQPLNIISMVMDKILFESDKTKTVDLEFLKTKSNKIFENIIRIRNIIDHIRAFSRSKDDYILSAFDITILR